MKKMRASLVPFLLLAAATLSVPTLAAEPKAPQSVRSDALPTTHVLGFVTGDNFEHAEALTRAAKQALSTSTNGRLGEGDFSLEVLTAALGCNEVPDASCLKKISAKTQSKRFIWGTLNVDGNKIVADVRLYDEGSAEKKAQFTYPAARTESTDAELLGMASRALSELMGPLTYKVIVRAEAEQGTVFVDGKPAGTLDEGLLTLDLPSGEHVFRLEAEGQAPAQATARVEVGDTTKVRLEAQAAKGTVAAPSEPTTGAGATQVSEPPDVAEKSTGSAQRTWGYITLGTGGVLLAAGGLAAGRLYQLNEDDTYQAYRAALSSSQDACTEAKNGREITGAMSAADVRSTCDSAETLELAQIVLFVGGAVVAGTGLTLLLTSKSSTPTATHLIEPRLHFGKNNADFGLVMHF